MRKIIIILLILTFGNSAYSQNKKSQPKKNHTVQKQVPKKQVQSGKKGNLQKIYMTSSIRGLQGQRASIQKKIKEQELALSKNKADVEERLQKLLVINSEIDQRQKNIEGIQQDITHLEGNIGILKSQLKTLEKQLQDRKNKYISSMRYMSRRHNLQDKLMFIFSAKNLAQMYRRFQFIRQYSSYQKAQGEMVQAKQLEINDKHKQLENVKGHKNNLLCKGQQEKLQLQGKQTEQQEVVKGLQQQQKTIQSIIDQQRQKDAALNAQIDRLVAQEIAKARARAAAEAKKRAAAAEAAKKRAAELARKKAAAEAAARENARRIAEAKAREEKLRAEAAAAAKAAEEARRAQAAAEAQKRAAAEQQARQAAIRKAQAEQAAKEAEAARVAAERKAAADKERSAQAISKAREEAEEANNFSTVDRMMSNGFESNRGRLPMPITGSYRIVSHFGQHSVEGLKGVTLDNKGINILGKPGCVARAVYDGEVSAVTGYRGTWVVMVRHGEYISVYCNLKSVSVRTGQKVSTRQALGTVGTDNILQFQLRKEFSKLNPEVWLGR